jgi:hypothetical protein
MSGFEEMMFSDPIDNLTNDTLSCAARSIQDSVMLPYSEAMTITLRVVIAFYYLISTLSGIILNSLVIALVVMYKKLHTHSFVIALQFVVIDLVRSLIFLFNIANIIANRWLFGEHMCAVIGISVSTLTQVRLH